MEWSEIALIVVSILLAWAGGHIKKLVKEFRALVDAIASAIEDNKIDDNELAEILRRYQNVKSAYKNIILAIGYLFTRR